jgi:hypothetical protein
MLVLGALKALLRGGLLSRMSGLRRGQVLALRLIVDVLGLTKRFVW